MAVGTVLHLLAHTTLGVDLGSGPESGSGTGSGSASGSGSGSGSVPVFGSGFEPVFECVSESVSMLEPCNHLRERKLFRKPVKQYKIRQWTNNQYNLFTSITNCVRMMEEVPESEYRELADNLNREGPQVADQPMLLVEDDESLLDMEEEETDEIMLLERAIAAAPSGASITTDAGPAAAAAVDVPSATASPAVAPSSAAAAAVPDAVPSGANAAAGAPLDAVQVDRPSPDPRELSQSKVNDFDSETVSDTQSGYIASSSSETCESSNFNYSKYGTRSRIGEGEKYIGSEKPPMSSNYYQCRAARGANMSHITYKVGLGPEAGTCENVS